MEARQPGDGLFETALGHEGAASGDPFDQSLVAQPFEGGADGDPADAEELDEFVLGGELLARRPLAQVDGVPELFLDLEPKRQRAPLKVAIKMTHAEVIIL